MGANTASTAAGKDPAQDDLIVKFARLMWKRYGARVYLFGSRARGSANSESDYDLVAVAQAFVGQPRIGRVPDRYDFWREAGGRGIGLDLHCYSPEEFRAELAGLGYLGQAKRRGELIRVTLGRAA